MIVILELTCEVNEVQSGTPTHDFPSKLAKPAVRALLGAGVTRLGQLSRMTETELSRLHGIGPNALKQLRIALDQKGITFKTGASDRKRVDRASRKIKASPQKLYQAFIDPASLISWLPPKGMTGEIYEFEARNGGAYRMALTYAEDKQAVPGKTTADTDVVKGKFLEFVPNERIVQRVEFESDDPVYAGNMTMTWTFTPVSGGTEVAIACEDVPEGIRQEDHLMGMNESLDNLALFAES